MDIILLSKNYSEYLLALSQIIFIFTSDFKLFQNIRVNKETGYPKNEFTFSIFSK